MALLSVLIPTFNRPDHLEAALKSLRYLQVDLEVIIGNNGEMGPVQKVVEKFTNNLKVCHNEVGSSYPQNLKNLVALAGCDWLTILHDDDFFTVEASCIGNYLCQDFDFLFSDHWIADPDGQIMLHKTAQNSKIYGRHFLVGGSVRDPELLWSNNAICQDCFFVRSHIAKSCFIDASLSVFADIHFLAQITSLVKVPIYISERCFAYRLSPDSLTSKGFPHEELLDVLKRCSAIIRSKDAQHELALRTRRQALHLLKFSLKRAKFRPAIKAIKAILFD